MALLRETLPKAAIPQPAPVQPRAVPMSTDQVEETPKAEVPFSTYVTDKFVELSNQLAGVPDTLDSVNSGEGLGRGKPLAKPKSWMDSYRVSNLVYHFGHSVLDGPLRDCGVKEPEMVSILRSLQHRLEMDA